MRDACLLDGAYNGWAMITYSVDVEQETDGRWIAEIADLPGVMVYGATADEVRAKVQALALRVVADRRT